MATRHLWAAVLLAPLLVCSGCQGDGNLFDLTQDANDPDVYVAGFYWGSGANRACYWKNGARTMLEDAGAIDSHAQSVVVSGKDVYIAGFHDSTACYWKNGVLHDLEANSYAWAIQVFDGKVYVAGESNGQPCYWVDGVKTTLGGGFTTARAQSIQVVPGQVYVGGNFNSQQACVWSNGSFNALPGALGSAVLGISGTATAGDWRAVGYYDQFAPYEVTKATSWVFPTKTDLPDAPMYSAATGIVLADGSYYISGNFNDGGTLAVPITRAAYWKDGVRTSLPGGTSSNATSIAVARGTVYAAGYFKSGTPIACYWAGGLPVPLEGRDSAGANAIAVRVK
jgi:hypothetical protein